MSDSQDLRWGERDGEVLWTPPAKPTTGIAVEDFGGIFVFDEEKLSQIEIIGGPLKTDQPVRVWGDYFTVTKIAALT